MIAATPEDIKSDNRLVLFVWLGIVVGLALWSAGIYIQNKYYGCPEQKWQQFWSVSPIFEYSGPGSIQHETEQRDEDRRNEEAHDRCDEGRGSERDEERARDYERDHYG